MRDEEQSKVRTRGDSIHTVLCVDDEKNLLNSLKRLLRKEGYTLLTASSGAEGLKMLEERDVHLVICDQRMPEMSGTDFLASVKEKYPDAIRIVLTGYTEVDAITESINKGHVYKFFLKPWNDQSLKLEIKQALEQYDLVQANKSLHQKVVEQNEALRRANENLETLVRQRTEDLEIQNQALELSRAILEDMPIPIVGVSAEGLIAITNHKAQGLLYNGQTIAVGKELADCFPIHVQEGVASALDNDNTQTLEGSKLPDRTFTIDATPLSGQFRGKGVILTLRPAN
ncbi:MAG: response regulator [Thermodesulfobacteriota bacterium]|nr:response regulator [Thermodesulfobacteriota bacterium]